MWKFLEGFFKPPVFQGDDEKTRIAGVLQRVLIAIYILLPIAVVAQIINPAIGRLYVPLAVTVSVLSTILLIAIRRGYVRAASIVLITVVLILSTFVELLAKGETRPVSIFSAAVIVACGLLFGPRGTLIAAILYSIKHALVLAIVHTNLISLVGAPPPTPFLDILITSVGYLMIAIIFGMASTSIYSSLTRAREIESQLTASNLHLQELTQNLEKRISERTTDLEIAKAISERRARQFEAITRVSRTINSTHNLQELLPQISEVISEQFGFYHVGIFLNDNNDIYAILNAANSEGGQKMLQRGHRLKIGEQGIVGYVTSTGEPRIALDVGADAVYFDNPDLPMTRSESALPLKISGKIVGALDVQSTEPNAFTNDDIEVLTTLADQVSLAIQNARLLEQTQKSLNEVETVYRQYLKETWTQLPHDQKLAGFRYSISGAIPIEESPQEKNRSGSKSNGDVQRQEVSVPVILRGEKIGMLSVQIPKQDRIRADQMDLIKAVAERVALSVENARLFEETTRRAERERLVSDITTKIRSSNDPQEMIRTAVEELQRALGATRVEVIPQRPSLHSDK